MVPPEAPLAVAVGDPAGVGPMVAATAAVALAPSERIALFGDATRLASLVRASAGDATVAPREVDASARLSHLPVGEVGCVSVSQWDTAVVARHAPTPEGGRHQLRALDAAIAAVRAGHARALVTGPTSKEAVVQAGVPFVGQTEHLARSVGLADDAVTMMFLGPRLRVALVTTHLAVRDVPPALTPERVARTARHLGEALLRLADRGAPPPRLVVTGLNPHAGEHGLFGDEEARAIAPGIARARAEAPFSTGAATLEGPVPAEAAFRGAASGRWDGVVTMMHDQATIPSKVLDWGNAVNVTWGLPFVRTSVDHGVAYDAAAQGHAEHDGMLAALQMAVALTRSGRRGGG
jgi:4-hydroxythreonine-4-phosphate dehydrogenase